MNAWAIASDLPFHRGTMHVPALSPEHFGAFLERTAGPLIKVVETRAIKLVGLVALGAHQVEQFLAIRSPRR